MYWRTMATGVNGGQGCNCRQISNISCTKYQNLNVSHIVLQLSLPKLLKPCVKSGMEMKLEQRRQVLPQLHLSDQ